MENTKKIEFLDQRLKIIESNLYNLIGQANINMKMLHEENMVLKKEISIHTYNKESKKEERKLSTWTFNSQGSTWAFTSQESTKKGRELSAWAFNSHWWMEYHDGYFKCKWCGALHLDITPINIYFPLCKGNPVLLKLYKKKKIKK